MGFYLVRTLFPAIVIDAYLSNFFFKKRRKRLGILVGSMVYPVGTLFWSVVLFLTDRRFQGQGVIGLYLLIAVGIAISIIRMFLGLLLLNADPN